MRVTVWRATFFVALFAIASAAGWSATQLARNTRLQTGRILDRRTGQFEQLAVLLIRRGGPVAQTGLADLRAGFTTVVDLGARTLRLLRIRESINAGLMPVEAIRAATTNAARAFGLADSLGYLARGMAADIVAVEGNPLDDLSALTRPRFVIVRGRVVPP